MISPVTARQSPADPPEVWLLDNHTTTGHALTLLLGDWGFAPRWMRRPGNAAGASTAPAVIMVDDGVAGVGQQFDELRMLLDGLATARPPLILLGYRDDIAAKLASYRVYGLAKPIEPERLRSLIELLIRPPGGV
jgi:hypothetical protein